MKEQNKQLKKDTWEKMGEIAKIKSKTVLEKLVEAQKDAGIKMTTAFNELSDRINEFVKEQEDTPTIIVDIPKWNRTDLELINTHLKSIKDIYTSIRSELPSDRGLKLSITKLEEAEMWLTRAITH